VTAFRLFGHRTAPGRSPIKEEEMFKLFATAAAIFVVAVGTATAGTGPTAQGLRADGLRWQGLADHYGRLQGLKADGLRWQAMARFYAKPAAPAVSASSSFHWSDAGVGLGAGLAVAVIGGAAIVFARRSRRTKLAL
jgi:hypothetical protein